MGLDIFSLEGKTAFITGGSKGLGLTFGHALAGVGANIILISRNQDEAESAAAEISEATGQKAIGLKADVTSEKEMQAVVARADSELEGVDILINNAGINIRKT